MKCRSGQMMDNKGSGKESIMIRFFVLLCVCLLSGCSLQENANAKDEMDSANGLAYASEVHLNNKIVEVSNFEETMNNVIIDYYSQEENATAKEYLVKDYNLEILDEKSGLCEITCTYGPDLELSATSYDGETVSFISVFTLLPLKRTATDGKTFYISPSELMIPANLFREEPFKWTELSELAAELMSSDVKDDLGSPILQRDYMKYTYNNLPAGISIFFAQHLEQITNGSSQSESLGTNTTTEGRVWDYSDFAPAPFTINEFYDLQTIDENWYDNGIFSSYMSLTYPTDEWEYVADIYPEMEVNPYSYSGFQIYVHHCEEAQRAYWYLVPISPATPPEVYAYDEISNNMKLVFVNGELK